MSFLEILLLAVGLSMDSLAVSVTSGAVMKECSVRRVVKIAFVLAFFQAMFTLVGYLLGFSFLKLIETIDHWIAFILLGLIGVNMIKEALGKEDDECLDDALHFGDLIMLSIATSVDALAVGITFAFFNVSIVLSTSIIGFITFIICIIGVKVGNVFGEKYKSKAELTGGILLIIMGCKILLDHLFF